MNKLNLFAPSDVQQLKMENELLALEVRFLKAKHASLGDVTPQRLHRLRQAEQDIEHLLRRLARTPLAPIFRLKKGYRDMEQTYLKR